jgi:CheY-like chemotaxis protein
MPSTNHERTRILVVDDEPSIVELITTILTQQGYETAGAANGALAVDLARSFRPHCVITDVLMPVMDGVEAAIRIKEMLPECKVLLISGHASAADLLKEPRAKGFDFPLLSKPTLVPELLRSVAAAVGKG